VFTGIVQSLGQIARLERRAGDVELQIDASGIGSGRLELGASVCVQGVCLTVTRQLERGFSADVSRETLACTTLGAVSVGDTVNLEPAVRAGDALGGHLVSGHVDGVGRLTDTRPDGRSTRLEFEIPPELARYVASKGSICIDGVSLTVNAVDGPRFGVNLIPHTLEATTLGALKPGAHVNVEVDMLARYLERLAQFKA
jgi:riboflavin synthase